MSLISIIASFSGGATTPTPPVTSTPLLIVFFGESNSGGLADNSDATAPELAERSVVKILDNVGLSEFQNLNIAEQTSFNVINDN